MYKQCVTLGVWVSWRVPSTRCLQVLVKRWRCSCCWRPWLSGSSAPRNLSCTHTSQGATACRQRARVSGFRPAKEAKREVSCCQRNRAAPPGACCSSWCNTPPLRHRTPTAPSHPPDAEEPVGVRVLAAANGDAVARKVPLSLRRPLVACPPVQRRQRRPHVDAARRPPAAGRGGARDSNEATGKPEERGACSGSRHPPLPHTLTGYRKLLATAPL